MKIAFMVSTVPEASETFILDQARALAAQGHHLDVYADYVKPPFQHGESISDHANVFVYCRRPAFRPQRWRWRLQRLAQALAALGDSPGLIGRAVNAVAYGRSAASLDLLEMALYFRDRPTYDIVHCHFGPNGVYAAMLSDLGVLRGALVTSFHGFDITVLPAQVPRGYYRRLFMRGDLFTCNSKFLEQRAIELGCPADKLMVLPVGVNTEAIAAHREHSASDTALEVLTVARLVEVKGVEFGLRCVARVATDFPQLRYSIVGEGPLMADLKQLSQSLGIREQVRFMGSLDHSQVCDLYRRADVFLLPGVIAGDGAQEAQGLALLEAQAAGVPVISSPVGGVADSVVDGESGFLVPQRDVDALAGRLRELLTQPALRARMGHAGRSHVARNFDLKVLTARLATLYEGLPMVAPVDTSVPAQVG